ncbi:hypothetical protein TrST_g10150 [Triparma strigata]|uniref:VDE lipocalin domain-containing protein n=1 Tax=Triparma strigata TaxID=1606541 RepID=A0A9W7E4K7_9STRA|nr:hypothetical protein TrST_g10150 [Triparma strigata]
MFRSCQHYKYKYSLLVLLLALTFSNNDANKVQLASRSTIVVMSSSHFEELASASASTEIPASLVLAIRSPSAPPAALPDSSPQAPLKPGMLLPPTTTTSSKFTSSTLSNPSQAFLLPPHSHGPLCVFTGFSKDIKSVHESLTTHLTDMAKIFASEGDVTNTANPVPSVTLMESSPFARMSAYECTSRISDLVSEDDLNVHGLVMALDKTSPSKSVVMDCTYDGAVRDWSKGGATAIGKRGWKVRRILANALFTNFDDADGLARKTFKAVQDMNDLNPTEKATEFAVQLIVKSMESTFDGEEDDEDKKGHYVFFVMTNDGVRRLDDDAIKKSLSLRGGFSSPSDAIKKSLSLRGGFSSPSPPIAKITFIAPTDPTPSSFGKTSPQSSPPTVKDVLTQITKKLYNCEDRIDTKITEPTSPDLPSLVQSSDIVVDLSNSDALTRMLQERKNQPTKSAKATFSSSATLSFLDSYDPSSPSPLASLAPWTAAASAKRLYEYTTNLISRNTTDDFVTALLLNVNAYCATVPWVEHSIDATWEKGPVKNAQEFASMINNCGPCVVACLQDENCKACIDALNEIDTRDQVESYRAVTSFESELLKDFSFCILQKNNVFGCSAEIPSRPAVSPGKFRSEALTFETASKILIGHLDDNDGFAELTAKRPVSWKVACGANVAYDQFTDQNQLFYKGRGEKDMWYDPVFKVQTLDGRNIWAKRHYKVRRGDVPGRFMLSVLDNGVTSLERWNIVACADDLSWCVFHYSGAASAVGQMYSGGLLCTPDGALPPSAALNNEVKAAFESVDIALWELFTCTNDEVEDDSGPAPLDFFRKVDNKKLTAPIQ